MPLKVNWLQLVIASLIRRVTLAALGLALGLRADPPRPVVEPVPDVYSPAPFDQQRLGGMLASRMRANTEGYLERIPLAEISSALNGTAEPERWTEGKSAGLLLEAGANSYEYSGDEQLKKVVDGLAKALISNQRSGAYIGSYPAAQRWSPDDISSQGAILLGLTAYYRVTGNDDALAASRRMANALMAHLSRGKGAVADARGVVRPLIELYSATGDRGYLAFCRKLAQSSFTQLGTESASTGLIPFLSGLASLYQLTGDEAYAKAAQSGWRRVRDQQLSVTGAPNTKAPADGGCATEAWLRLNYDLLRVYGEPQFAQEIEHTLYNQLLAFQDPETGKIDPDVSEDKARNSTSKIDPCAAAVSLAISEIPDMMWGRLGAGLAVLSYQPGRANLRTRRRTAVQLYTEGEYPVSGKVLLHVEPNHDAKFPLELLVPSWTKSFTASIGATNLQGKPGEFLILDREWKKGDTVTVSIEMSVSQVTVSARAGQLAVQRGAQLLCLVKQGGVNDFLAAAISAGKLSLKAAGSDGGTYAAPGTYNGKPQDLPLAPFANPGGPCRLWIKAAND